VRHEAYATGTEKPVPVGPLAGAVSRFQMGVVIASGLSIGTLFTLFVVPAVYLVVASEHHAAAAAGEAARSYAPAT